jgi:acyl-CoA dehydrogenase
VTADRADQVGVADASERELLANACAELFGGESVRETSALGLWERLRRSGLHAIAVPEICGGSGGSLVEAALVVEAAARHSVELPVGECNLLAGWLCAEATLPLRTGPMTAVDADTALELVRAESGWAVRGRIERVPYADVASTTVALVAAPGAQQVVLLDRDCYATVAGTSLSGEPRDTIVVDCRLGADRVIALDPGVAEEFVYRNALLRAIQLAGAAQGCLESTVRYVTQREQFGRSIARFQAVQQQLAECAARVCAVHAAVDAAVLASTGGVGGRPARIAIAAAKIEASAAAGVIARIGHQLHGAIGFTAEHDLHRSTTRLWTWREEGGNERYWSRWLAATVRDAGDVGLWALLTES